MSVEIPVEAVESDVTSFGGLLAQYRGSRSRHSLAHEVGVDPSYLTRIESGERQPPKLEIIEALARTLGLIDEQRFGFIISAGHAPEFL